MLDRVALTGPKVTHQPPQPKDSANTRLLGAQDIKKRARAPIWPVLIAPLVACAYYMVIKSAFEQSIASVFSDVAGVDTAATWGTHWFYRLVAESCALTFGTFVAAGLARHREPAAGLTGGISIAAAFILFWGLFLCLSITIADFDPEQFLVPAPWYQHAIDGLIVIAAPLVGLLMSEQAEILNKEEPVGFAGINRWHFLWLGIAAHWYAIGLILPTAIWLRPPYDTISHLIKIILLAVPIAALIIPACYGLAFLSAHEGTKLSPSTRNVLGAALIILGFLVGYAIQVGWAALVKTLLSLIGLY
jgi:hypothetical protein